MATLTVTQTSLSGEMLLFMYSQMNTLSQDPLKN